jgi:hypothetical protein
MRRNIDTRFTAHSNNSSLVNHLTRTAQFHKAGLTLHSSNLPVGLLPAHINRTAANQGPFELEVKKRVSIDKKEVLVSSHLS